MLPQDYGKILQKRKALSQVESALRLRATKKKKKKSRGSRPKEARSTSSSEESLKDSSDG